MEINTEEIAITTIRDLIGFASRCGLQQNMNSTIILGPPTHRKGRRISTTGRLSSTVTMISQGPQILSENAPMTGLAMCNLFQHLKKLSILNIQDDFVNTVLLHIIKYLPCLTILRLEGCTRLTNDVLKQIIANCSALRYLNIQGCLNITPHTIQSLWTVRKNNNLRISEYTPIDTNSLILFNDKGEILTIYY
jgi:hypothetical protein